VVQLREPLTITSVPQPHASTDAQEQVIEAAQYL
jgi:hypothetical protein